MALTRRCALKVLAGAGLAAASGPARARDAAQPPADAAGMLYDTTLCIGCQACVVACREANDLPPERGAGGLHDAPADLSCYTKNVIQQYREGHLQSYVKRQCMHCVDPACVSACMLGALQKREFGIVTWDVTRCIGCRYCQVACPFNVPKFEWESANPSIVKCEMCSHLLAAGGSPACCRVCPRDAVIFGRRDELLAEAKRRLEAHPGRYVPRVYGEHEGGGTQVLYLSHVPFEKLGLPPLDARPVPYLSETLQHGIYRGFLAPAVLYAALGVVLWKNRKRRSSEEAEPPP